MTPGDIINEVRRLEQDSGLLRSPDSYIDETMLTFVNHTLKQTAVLRPDLFSNLGDLETVPGSVVQTMPQDSIRLIEIFHVKGGGSVNEVSHAMMERSARDWASSPSGKPLNYMRHPRNPNRYFLYPPPEAEVVLVADYAQTPPNYGLEDEIALIPAAYQTALVYGTVMTVASINNTLYKPDRVQMYTALYQQTLNIAGQMGLAMDVEPEQDETEQPRRRRRRN